MRVVTLPAAHAPGRIDRRVGVATIALGAGGLILLGRPLLESGPHGPILLVLAYSALLALSLAPETPVDLPGPLAGTVVMAGGIATVLVAAAVSGPPVPLVVSAWVVPLNVAAAVAEEAFFRRLLYGTLRRWGVIVAVLGSALAFALLHVPFYGPAVFWVDLGAGLLFGWQRWASGGWGAPAVTHAAANLLAAFR